MSDERKMPQTVSEEQIGATQAEQDWRNLPDPRPPVSRWLFFFVGLAILIAFALSGIFYYHKNVVPERLFDRAENYLRDGDYAGAYRLFEEVYEIKPKRKDVIYRLGNCLEKMERFDSAANRYREHLEKLPGDPKALQALGTLYLNRLDKKDEGFDLIKQAAEKMKDSEAWEAVVQAAKNFKTKEEVISALAEKLEHEKKAEQLCADAKRLFSLGAYQEALAGYKKAFKADESDAIKASIKACRKALGLPDSKEHTIFPGKALGEIEIGDSKKEVKKAMGGKSPEKKLFVPFGGKTELADKQAEIWYYSLGQPDQFRIIFNDEKVMEIETASDVYKTEDGLCTANCTDEHFADKVTKSEAVNSAFLYSVKKGGLTFYVAPTKKGEPGRYRKLRVFKGEKSAIDNESGFSLLNLREK